MRALLLGRQELAWRARGSCLGISDPDLFFPVRGEASREAKAICADCVVRTECLEYGLGEKFGIWGGLSEHERRGVRKERKAAGTPVQMREPLQRGLVRYPSPIEAVAS